MACWGSNYHEMKEGMALILAKHDIYSLAWYYYAYSNIDKGLLHDSNVWRMKQPLFCIMKVPFLSFCSAIQ